MCGICGIFDFNKQRPVDTDVVDAMLQVMRHRGPDDDGKHIDKNLAIGMRRLSIIDLVSGHQPIYNEDRSITVVFNGEIYTYRELAEQLKQRGHKFTTASDTEVIVHLYEEYGQDCVQWLRGMFAFALWDAKCRKLLIVRDRLGIKPLYYAQARNQLVFASEIKSILQHPDIGASLDIVALNHFLSLRYVPSPQTMFNGILSLPPGHFLICDENGVVLRPFWDMQFSVNENGAKSEREYAEELMALVEESVKLRLRSDVPFGAFLSGGIDSSMVVALMTKFLNEPVKTFSVGFKSRHHAAPSELPYARLIADRFQTRHHEILIGPDDFIDLAQKVIWHLDQPIADQATVATYMLSKLAAQHVKMVLTGEGGDELFAGYARYAGERFFPFVRHLPDTFKLLALSMSNRLPGLYRPKLALYALCQEDESVRFTNWFPLFNQDRKAQLLSKDFRTALMDLSTNDVIGQQLAKTDAKQPLNRMLYVDTKLWLPDYLLLRGDKLSMAASLEARVPLLDHKLVEFAAALPPHLKLNGLKRKYLLKKVCQALIPAQIVNRKKQGFPIPISAWFRREARSFVRDMLSPAVIQRRGLFNGAYVEKLLKEHEAGFAEHGNLLWGLMSVEIWLRLFVDSTQVVRSQQRVTDQHISRS